MGCYYGTTCLEILYGFNKRKPWKLGKCSEASEIVSMVWFSLIFCLYIRHMKMLCMYRELFWKPEIVYQITHIENGS